MDDGSTHHCLDAMHDLQGEVAVHVPVAPQLGVPKLLSFSLHTLAHCLPHHLPGAFQGTPHLPGAHSSWLEHPQVAKLWRGSRDTVTGPNS